MKGIKDDETAAPYDFHSEFLKILDNEMRALKIFHNISNTRTNPQSWLNSTFVILPKKKNECKEVRWLQNFKCFGQTT